MAEHTPGPLIYSVLRGTENPATLYADEDGEDIDIAVFERWLGDEAEQIANAKRLVACWNACKGIPTEELEAAAASDDPPPLKALWAIVSQAAANLETPAEEPA